MLRSQEGRLSDFDRSSLSAWSLISVPIRKPFSQKVIQFAANLSRISLIKRESLKRFPRTRENKRWAKRSLDSLVERKNNLWNLWPF
jgi:hypothetical protein